MPEEVKEEAVQEKIKKGGKKRLLLFILVGIFLIGITGGVVFLILGKKGEGEKGKTGETGKAEVEVVYSLQPVVVNLMDPYGKRYLQIGLALGLVNKKAEEKIKHREPMIRDILISFLSSKSPEEVLQPETKEIIKRELKMRINQSFGEELIKAVYITQYIVE